MLSTIAERAGLAVPGSSRDILSAMALESLKSAMIAEEMRLAEEGEPFSDEKKSDLALLFAAHSPIGFLVSLPELIASNTMRFDDEENLEKCVFKCLEVLFEKGHRVGGEWGGRMGE